MATDPEARRLYDAHVKNTRSRNLLFDAVLRTPGAGVELDVRVATVSSLAAAGGVAAIASLHRVRGSGVDESRFLLRQDLEATGDIRFEVQDKPTDCRHIAPFPAWQDFPGGALKLIDWIAIPPTHAEIRFAPEGTMPVDPSCPDVPGASILELTLTDPLWEPERGSRVLIWVESDPATARSHYAEHHLAVSGSVRTLRTDDWQAFGTGWVAMRRSFHDPSQVSLAGKSLRYSELLLRAGSLRTHTIPEGLFDCPTLYGPGW